MVGPYPLPGRPPTGGIEAVADELTDIERACEVAAVVLEQIQLDQERSAERSLGEPHAWSSSAGERTRNRPPQSEMNRSWAMISSLRFHGRMRM